MKDLIVYLMALAFLCLIVYFGYWVTKNISYSLFMKTWWPEQFSFRLKMNV